MHSARGIEKREIEGRLLVPHSDLKNTYVYTKDDGEIGFSSFSLHGRKLILKKLLELEEETHFSIITEEELKFIDSCWEKDGGSRSVACRTAGKLLAYISRRSLACALLFCKEKAPPLGQVAHSAI